MEELTIALVKRTAELGPLLLGSGPNRGHCAVEHRREITFNWISIHLPPFIERLAQKLAQDIQRLAEAG